MARIKFKVAARTDVGLVRTNNEDNFQISRDLSIEPMRWVNNEMCQLGDFGSLLVVADGMGGANAGEVASQIAMDTIKTEFSLSKLKDVNLTSADVINAYIRNVIVLADANIKSYAKTHSETKGMGTTIVVAWLLKEKLYIGWCGDSRAYIFNPSYGLVRLTKDHSYVQQLVDSGKLSQEEAFDYPDSNIITKCLSDSSQKAEPDTLSSPITVSNGDIILLCTDGLCGMIKDSVISTVIKASNDNLTDLANDLVSAALKASGADNVTIAICKICSGARLAPQKLLPSNTNAHKRRQYLTWFGAIALLVVIGICILYLLSQKSSSEQEIDLRGNSERIESADSLREDSLKLENDIQKESDGILVDETIKDPQPISPSILSNLKKSEIQVPHQKEEVEQSDGQSTSTEETTTMIVRVPSGMTIRAFMKKHGMSSMDFKKLNPDIEIDSLKPGMKVKIYSKQ